MKVAVFYGQEDVRIEERPIPSPAPNQLLVKIEYCGICIADINSYRHGGPIRPPIVFGHENIGTVVQLGDGVAGFAVGDRIICGPPSHCAEGCPSCKRGETNVCLHAFPRTAGIGRPDGGYAEYMLITDPAHTMLFKVPEQIDSKEAVLFDIICVPLHAIRKSRFRFGDNVLVSGTGSVGLAAIRMLRAAGAKKIVALETESSKFEQIKQHGADYCINPNECGDLSAEIRAAFGSEVGADVSFECAGNNASLENCVYHGTKPGGQVMMIGTIGTPMTLIPAAFAVHEIELKSTFVYTEEEVNIYLDMVNSGKLSFLSFVTDIVSLDHCVEQGLARKDRSNQLKILIDPFL